MILFLLACSTEAPVPTPGPAAPGPAANAPAPAPAPAPAEKAYDVRLGALVPTSGRATGLFDGDPKNGFRPPGGVGDGLLLRFETPQKISTFTVTSCGGDGFELTPFYNGGMADSFDVAPSGGGDPDRLLRSVFLRVDAGDACFGEIVFNDGEKDLSVGPPRSVKGSVRTSSTLAPANAYHPSYMFDSRYDFGWVEGSAGNGIGESVTLTLDEPMAVSKLQIWNGYQRSQDHFDKNARMKKIAVSVGGARQEFDLEVDTFGPQVVSFASPVTGSTIEVEVLDAVKGSKYKDMVISELRIWDDKGPVAVEIGGREARAAAVKKKAAGSAIEAMIDHQFVGACEGDGMRSLKLRSDNSFVWYEEFMEDTEIFDGAWVIKGAKDGGMGIQLYGRRHRSEENWDPYASNGGVVETVKIGGGKPVFHAVAGMDQATFDTHIAAIKQAAGRACAYDKADLAKKGAVLVRDPSMVDVLIPR